MKRLLAVLLKYSENHRSQQLRKPNELIERRYWWYFLPV